LSNNYTQCRLVRDNVSTTSWIPTECAHKNRDVTLRETKGSDPEHWTVKEIFATREYGELPDFRKSIRTHRKRTGDSNAKVKS
jgi:hypothetical protein